MVNDTKKLAKLIVSQQKFVDKNWETFKDKIYSAGMDEKIDFYDEYLDEIKKWEKDVIEILEKFNKDNYLIKFLEPNVISSTGLQYITRDLDDKVTAQIKALTEILTEEEVETAPKQSKKIVYWIEYADNRQITINGRNLRRPKFNSLNNSLIEYLMKFPNKTVELETVEKVMECEGLSNGISGRVRDLGFGGDWGRMFFPVVNKRKIKLVNPVTRQYLIDNHLPDLDLDSIM